MSCRLDGAGWPRNGRCGTAFPILYDAVASLESNVGTVSTGGQNCHILYSLQNVGEGCCSVNRDYRTVTHQVKQLHWPCALNPFCNILYAIIISLWLSNIRAAKLDVCTIRSFHSGPIDRKSISCNIEAVCPIAIYLSHKSRNAPVPYPKKCTIL